MNTHPLKSVVTIQDLAFSYTNQSGEAKTILSSFELDVGQSEFVVLLGPSGCGKTTLLNLVAGLLLPESGTLEREPDLPFGYMFQEYPFLPRKTARQHVAFPLNARGYERSNAKRLADDWLRKIDLEDYADYPVTALSAGMKARVAMATVMIANPTLLLLDEPFRALDLETRLRMWQYLRIARLRDDTSALIVTHDLNEAIVLGDRVAVMSGVPSKVISTHDVDFDESASPIDILQSEAAGHLYQNLWLNLRKAFQPEGRRGD
jgi:NitT/TauT family transport system ATP-binding protein